MARKAGPTPPRSVMSFRPRPENVAGLKKLGRLRRKTPRSDLINDAIAEYLARHLRDGKAAA